MKKIKGYTSNLIAYQNQCPYYVKKGNKKHIHSNISLIFYDVYFKNYQTRKEAEKQCDQETSKKKTKLRNHRDNGMSIRS